MEENTIEYQYRDLLHIYYSEIVDSFPDTAKSKLYGVTFKGKIYNSLEAIYKYTLDFVKWLLKSDQTDSKKIINKNWLYIVGSNNYNSVHFLQDTLEQCVFISPYHYKNDKSVIFRVVSPVRILYLLKSIPLFFLLLFKKKQFDFKKHWDILFRSLGAVESAKWLLKKFRPANIIFSNDHTIEPRALLLAAKQLNIPTFYIQHACVRKDFPPLKFDYNLLEGQFAHDVYSEIAPIEGVVKLIGIPRMDEFIIKKNRSTKIKYVGICTNLLDDISQIEQVINKVINNFPDLVISYRPHPSDKRSLSIPSDRLIFSDASQEPPLHFLQNQDLIIAGDTSIHYEAVMINVFSIYYNYGAHSRIEDLYLFCKNGISKPTKSISDLIETIKSLTLHKPDVFQKAAFYNSTIGTDMEGKSKQLAIDYINNIIRNQG